jgi:hypothetical protein
MEFLLNTINNNLMLSQYIPFHHNDHISKYQCSFYYLVYAYSIFQKGNNNSFILSAPSYLYPSCWYCTMLLIFIFMYNVAFKLGFKVLLVLPGFYWYFYTIRKLPLCSDAILVFRAFPEDIQYQNIFSLILNSRS